MADNTWTSGSFYASQSSYITRTNVPQYTSPTARPGFLMELEGSKETDVWAFKKARGSGVTMLYHVNANGTITVFNTGNPGLNEGQTAWSLSRHDHPAYFVFVAPDDTLRYLTYTSDTSGVLVASATPPPNTTQDQAQFIGPYLDILADDGISIYRMTINTNNSIPLTLVRTEPWRIQTRYFSQGLQFAFRSGQLYHEAIIDVADIDMSVEETEWGYGGVVVPRISTVTLELATDELDYLANQRWDTRRILIRSGSIDRPYNTWPIILRAQTQSAEWDEDRLQITLRDYGTFFDRSMQPNTYKGTGFMEGTTELAGHVKPLCYGACRHISPVLIDPTHNVYQVHDGPIEGISGVFDRGIPKPFVGDTSGIVLDSVWDWNPSEQHASAWITDRSNGLIRLASPPAGRVTAVVIGTKDMNNLRTLAAFVKAVSQKRLPELPILQSSFDQYQDRIPHDVNLYVDQERTIRDAFQEMIGTTGGIVGINRLGEIFIRQLETAIPRDHITKSLVTENTKLRRFTPPKPGAIYKCGANRVYTVMTEEEIATNAAPSVRGLLSQEYRYTISDLNNYNDPIPHRRYESAKTITIDTPFDNISESIAWVLWIALRQIVCRDVYEISVNEMQYLVELGDTFLIEYPRWNLKIPKYFTVIAIQEKANERSTILRLWGG